MFIVYISKCDSFDRGRYHSNVFDLDFPLWFYALVSLAGLSLQPWFHLIGCIVFKIISKVGSSINLNWLHAHRPANKTKPGQKTRVQCTIITQPKTIHTKSTSGYSSYSHHMPTSVISTVFIKP